MWVEEFCIVTVNKTHADHEYSVYIVSAEESEEAIETLRRANDLSNDENAGDPEYIGNGEYVVAVAGISPDRVDDLVCTFQAD